MSDNSNADTEADEQTVAELKERIGELEERVEQQEEAQRGTSRRQFLGSLTGIASAGAAGYYLGTQRAQAAPSWGSASGQMGTDSTPLSDVIAQTGTFQSLSAEQADINLTGTERTGMSFGTTYQNNSGAMRFVTVRAGVNPSSGSADINYNLFVGPSSSGLVDGANRQDQIRIDGFTDRADQVIQGWVPDGHYYSVNSQGDESLSGWVEWDMK